MGLRLWLARRLMDDEDALEALDRVAELTMAALDDLIDDVSPGLSQEIRARDPPMEGDLDQRRRAMALAHRARVRALVDLLGEEEAVREGRRRMDPVGERLGMEARLRLSLGDDLDELVEAAKLVYSVLDIGLEVVDDGNGDMLIRFDRCALAHVYDDVTCQVMGAADEALMRGLNGRVEMRFLQRMTQGCDACVAKVKVEGVEEAGGAEGA